MINYHVVLTCVLFFSLMLPHPAVGVSSMQNELGQRHSDILQHLAPRYAQIARENIITVNNRTAIVPSPIYANGIYARDAFFAGVGLDDQELSFKLYEWFAAAQDSQTGQIPTAIAFDRADHSLQPQDDESTLLFVIWSFILHRTGFDVDVTNVEAAWGHVQTHVRNGRYYSSPGHFRYWADCWTLPRADVISYVQGLYAVAAHAAHYFGQVSDYATVDAAKFNYQALYNAAYGFLPLSASGSGRSVQDVSALLPEFLHRFLLDDGILSDAKVTSTVDRHLATLSAYSADGTLIGIKVLADRTGGFLPGQMFAEVCSSMSNPGDYHNGGYWPMYTIVELALGYSISQDPKYRIALEQLVEYEAEQGMGVEYWQLMRGSEGNVPPGRGHYSWNVFGLLALQYAGLVI